MLEINQQTLSGAIADIRIMRLKGDKARGTSGPDAMYEVFFELSIVPTIEWIRIFEKEWRGLNPRSVSGRSQDARVERGFLVINCTLHEIAAVHLPVLKMAVTSTNQKCRS